jgi:hypothetical protein
MTREPVQLLEQGDLSPAERALLEAGRAGAPVEYDVAAGATRFQASLAALAAAGASATLHRATNGSGAGAGEALPVKVAVKLLLGVAAGVTLVGGGIVAGVLLARRPVPMTPPQSIVTQNIVTDGPTRSVARSIAAAEGDRSSAPVFPDAPPSPPSPPSPTGAADAEHGTVRHSAGGGTRRAGSSPSVRSAAPMPPVAGDVRDSEVRSPAESAGTAGVAGAATQEVTDAVHAQPTAVTSAGPTPPGIARARDTEPPRRAEVTDSLSELRAVAVARNLLDRDPQAALGVLDKLRRDVPRGYFVEERQALTVLALAGAGQTGAARQQAAAFLRVFPNGPFSDRVRAVLPASN